MSALGCFESFSHIWGHVGVNEQLMIYQGRIYDGCLSPWPLLAVLHLGLSFYVRYWVLQCGLGRWPRCDACQRRHLIGYKAIEVPSFPLIHLQGILRFPSITLLFV